MSTLLDDKLMITMLPYNRGRIYTERTDWLYQDIAIVTESLYNTYLNIVLL